MDEGLGEHLGQLQFSDNQLVIDLLDKPNYGIFHKLDDQTQLNEKTQKDNIDIQFLNEIRNSFKQDPHFQTPKISGNPTFIIMHSAKDVEYTTTGFIEKNKDQVPKETLILLQNSQIDNLKDFYKFQQKEITGRGAKFLSYKFRNEMSQLMKELMECDCHFIRCVKSNE